MNRLVALVIAVLGSSVCSGAKLKVYNNVTDLQYNSIPKLFHLDNYDTCMQTNEPLYCYTTIQLSPIHSKEPSETWNIIQEIISLPRNYRHDKLRHGLCIAKACPDIPGNQYAVGNGTDKLWQGISRCYSNKYASMGLKGNVIKIHCETNKPFYEVDYLDNIYLLAIVILIGLIVIGTTFEGICRNHPDEYDKLISKSTIRKVLTAFSLIKNWERLRSDSSSEDSAALAPIQGIRVYNMYFVTSCHTFMLAFLRPVENTKYVEDATTITRNMMYSNGSLTCQTFFLISGWLLSYNFLIIFENKKVQIKHLILAFFNRFLRFAPILLLSVGFSATWLRHLGNGPIWDRVIGNEFKNCRKNWIWTFLYVNNYVNREEMCLQQTWYLACDNQVFILGLFVMMYVINNLKHVKRVFSLCILFGVFITFSEHYIGEYDIVFRSYPETVYTVYLEYKNWLYMFATGHHQIPAYTTGLAYGYLFYIFRKEKRQFHLYNKFFATFFYIFVWVLPVGTILVAIYFYQDGFETTRFYAALYQSLGRLCFSVPIGAAIFAFTMGAGGIMRSVCIWAPVQILGRISFSVYLLHGIPLRIKGGLSRHLYYASDYLLFYDSVGDYVLGYLIGTIGCLFVEMPVSALQKLIMNTNKEGSENEQISKKDKLK